MSPSLPLYRKKKNFENYKSLKKVSTQTITNIIKNGNDISIYLIYLYVIKIYRYMNFNIFNISAIYRYIKKYTFILVQNI